MGSTVFASDAQAYASLLANKFDYTQPAPTGGRQTATFQNKDGYLRGYARIAAFLCDRPVFEAALTTVSSQLWDAYRGFGPDLRNKFTRALNKVAAAKGFDYQNRFAANTNNSRPIGVRLIGGDPQLGYMLRNKLFWKDSMDLHHGEHSHSVQWLAAAEHLGAMNPTVPELYAETGNFRAASKDDIKGERSMLMWQWIADCFPVSMSRLATAQFLNGETLESDSYRSPQNITDHLVNRGRPIDGHFLSTYLFHRYKNRNWLKTEDRWDEASQSTQPKLTALYSGQANVRPNNNAATRRHGWVPSPSVPQARQIRDVNRYSASHQGAPVVSYDMVFHQRKGKLCYYYAE